MLAADTTDARPTLTGLRNLTAALAQIGKDTASPAEVWRRLTDSYVVDLDAVASILPRAEPEPTWLVPRNEDRLVTRRSRADNVSLRA
ncbi:hypothetical protein [Methylobacterium sp. WCS2018Hpa-22]|uniref:hypothetical protein n=1 Tax=Methylobacterium sp. WCS2018Hpa-22 TaxID=3073633 RepID=UPI00288B8376|nr:hypothetical protein [Methylobacterium sp. WCS2018Hpa-22]